MEDVGLLSILWIGLFLGIKHAIEPDHVIAVSTIASQSQRLLRSSLTGVFWGIGHTATLFIVGITIILLKGEIPEVWSMSLEFLVGIMLVYFGIASFMVKKHKDHEGAMNKQGNKEVSYGKSLLMGVIHGLAGSSAMIILTMSTVSSIWEGALYIVIFGVGTVVGMLCFTTILGIPFILSSRKATINRRFIQATGIISAAFGVYYMYNLGISEGLFKLWIS